MGRVQVGATQGGRKGGHQSVLGGGGGIDDKGKAVTQGGHMKGHQGVPIWGMLRERDHNDAPSALRSPHYGGKTDISGVRAKSCASRWSCSHTYTSTCVSGEEASPVGSERQEACKEDAASGRSEEDPKGGLGDTGQRVTLPQTADGGVTLPSQPSQFAPRTVGKHQTSLSTHTHLEVTGVVSHSRGSTEQTHASPSQSEQGSPTPPLAPDRSQDGQGGGQSERTPGLIWTPEAGASPDSPGKKETPPEVMTPFLTSALISPSQRVEPGDSQSTTSTKKAKNWGKGLPRKPKSDEALAVGPPRLPPAP